jgi:hypothetical protein
MEAHQTLLNPISGDCCHAMLIDLLNGDDRPGPIRIELLLRDTFGKPGSSLLLGSIAIPSSQLQHIALNRPPVPESLRFQMPAKARGRRFDEFMWSSSHLPTAVLPAQRSPSRISCLFLSW